MRAKTTTAIKESRFTFIHLSHPADVRDQNTMHYVRHTAIKHVSKIRRMRCPKKWKFQLVFKLQVPNYVLLDAVALLRVELQTLDPFVCYFFTLDNYASTLCSNSKLPKARCKLLKLTIMLTYLGLRNERRSLSSTTLSLEIR